jgi:hypothetical protein
MKKKDYNRNSDEILQNYDSEGSWMAKVRSTHGEKRVLVGKPEEERPLGRPRCRLENDNKMCLREIR